MKYSIENEFISVQVKKYGAELSSLKSKETGREYLWQGNPDIWYGQSPLLFPIVGTLLDDKYLSDGKEYTLYRHGIARKRDFELKEQSETKLVLTQKYSDETLEAYPFKYEIDLIFSLEGKKLTVKHIVRNLDDKEMFFSIGAHPGFNCDIGDVLEFEYEEDELVNEMIDSESILIDEHFPSPVDGKIFTISEHIFDKDVHILSNLKSNKCTLKSKNRKEEVEFDFGSAPILGLWAKPAAPYVCIEPWFGINDSREKKSDISEKRAIQSIKPSEEFDFAYSALIKE